MPIRITGMVSNMDTEAMIKELVSAYRLKSEKYVKAQKKLSWKQDSWAAMNKKIKSFYSTVRTMKFSAGYDVRSASISDATKATVSASSSAINGTYELEINKTAKGGYVTGSNLGSNITKDSTLADLGITSSGKISVSTGGNTTDIEVTSGMKVSEFVDKLNTAGVKANYDEGNHRIYIASSGTGKEADFSLSGTGTSGADALKKLGLSVKSNANTQNQKDWAAYALNSNGTSYITGYDSTGKAITNGTYDAGKTKTNIDNVLTQLRQDSATYTNNTAQIAFANAYETVSNVEKNLSSQETAEMKSLMEERDLSNIFVGNNGGIYEKLNDGTYKNKTDGSILPSTEVLEEGALRLSKLQVKAGLATEETDADGKVTYNTDTTAVNNYKGSLTTVALYKAEADNADEVADIEAAYTNGTLNTFVGSLQTAADDARKYMDDNKLLDGKTMTAGDVIEKITDASGILDGSISVGYSDGATRVDGQDAEITLNGAKYTSTKNDFSINGLNISALAETTGKVTISVANNTQGLYDKIKSVLTEYNALINEMTGSYNAPKSKGFEPLTTEERDAMSDTEIAEWEKKIKDSVLRRDDTLESLLHGFQSSMLKSYEVDGKMVSLSTFGISTLGVLYADENEENAFHIDGDKADSLTSGKPDKLMEALTNNSDQVVGFMQQLMGDVYDKINKKMSSTELSSFDYVYNDKEMAKEYSDYTTTIKKWEDKLKQIEESYYKKFAAMESALAKLNSQQSSLASMLG